MDLSPQFPGGDVVESSTQPLASGGGFWIRWIWALGCSGFKSPGKSHFMTQITPSNMAA
jgi:hypothetical protein